MFGTERRPDNNTLHPQKRICIAINRIKTKLVKLFITSYIYILFPLILPPILSPLQLPSTTGIPWPPHLRQPPPIPPLPPQCKAFQPHKVTQSYVRSLLVSELPGGRPVCRRLNHAEVILSPLLYSCDLRNSGSTGELITISLSFCFLLFLVRLRWDPVLPSFFIHFTSLRLKKEGRKVWEILFLCICYLQRLIIKRM